MWCDNCSVFNNVQENYHIHVTVFHLISGACSKPTLVPSAAADWTLAPRVISMFCRAATPSVSSTTTTRRRAYPAAASRCVTGESTATRTTGAAPTQRLSYQAHFTAANQAFSHLLLPWAAFAREFRYQRLTVLLKRKKIWICEKI